MHDAQDFAQCLRCELLCHALVDLDLQGVGCLWFDGDYVKDLYQCRHKIPPTPQGVERVSLMGMLGTRLIVSNALRLLGFVLCAEKPFFCKNTLWPTQKIALFQDRCVAQYSLRFLPDFYSQIFIPFLIKK